jgi:ribosomal protein S18 acetylase RimI-like enzyme
MKIPIHIAAAASDEPAWCAKLMASSEPWITLGRDFASCSAALTRPGSELYVARAGENGPQAGFILVAPRGLAGSPYIASLGVAAEMRGQGIGSQLLDFAERLFAGRGHIFLMVSSFNHSAQQLYRRHGYERVGEVEDYCVAGHSELIFHKKLK